MFKVNAAVTQLARLALLAVVLSALSTTLRAKESLNGVALVIGQSKYEHIPALANPANDAREMVKLLSDLGFDARSVSDRDVKKLKRDLERFVEDAEGADVAFLYYSGHGIESGGENWLIPVDTDISSLGDAQETLVALSSVMDELKEVVPVTIMLLDACRTNPFPADALVKKSPGDPGAPIGAGGLTPVRGATALASEPAAAESLGTVIGFAAEPGRPALDGTVGENSPYASALLRHLGAMEGVDFGQVMRMVTEEVYLDTKTKQRPWVNETLRRLLFFGVPQPEPTGEEGLITGERRQLLLTISDLPDFNRAQVETVAAKDGVPLDALYGVLRALGTAKIPEDPTELEKLLDAQADGLKEMLAQRDALRTDDPEIKRLTDAADRAIRQGAIVTAKQFLDQAVQRVEATRAQVDAAEEAVKNKRIADAAIYAQRARAATLGFDYLAAAADYGRAFALAERWDDELRRKYKNGEAQSLMRHGQVTGDQTILAAAEREYHVLLSFTPAGKQDNERAQTLNDMAIALQTVGELSTNTDALEEAAELYQEALEIFERERNDPLWAAAQNNIGTVLLEIGQRESNPTLLQEALAAFRAALGKRDRTKLPLDWAATQNNIGIVLHELGDRSGSVDRLADAETAYRLALAEYSREGNPVEWAMVTNNLGLVVKARAVAKTDLALYKQAADLFRATLEVRTRDHLPLKWADSQGNLAGTLVSIARLEGSTESLDEVEKILRDVLTVNTREHSPLDWASTQNTLGSALQAAGQLDRDTVKLQESAEAYRAAMQESTEARVPLDYAMLNFNLGNTLQLSGQISDDPALLKESLEAYAAALRHYTRETSPKQWAVANASKGATLQSLAFHENAIENYKESIAARRAALEVLTSDNASNDWANAQNGLGLCLLNLSIFDKQPALLPDAMAAFVASQEVFTRDGLPVQWAFAESSIGDVHMWLGWAGGGKAEFDKAIARFESSKEVFTQTGYFPSVQLIDQKIAMVKEAVAKAKN